MNVVKYYLAKTYDYGHFSFFHLGSKLFTFIPHTSSITCVDSKNAQ